MATKTSNRTTLSDSLLSFIQSPTHQNREYLFSQILNFANVKAKAHLRPYAQWWNENAGDTFIAIEELADYAIMTFLNYLESERFDEDSWKDNPMANLNRFFQCRALEWCRSEMNRIKRQTRPDVSPVGWDGVQSHHASPEHELIVAKIEEAYTRAVEGLPEDLKRIVRGKRQGKKSAQVAVELGIPVKAVYEGTRKARALLRVELQAYLSA